VANLDFFGAPREFTHIRIAAVSFTHTRIGDRSYFAYTDCANSELRVALHTAGAFCDETRGAITLAGKFTGRELKTSALSLLLDCNAAREDSGLSSPCVALGFGVTDSVAPGFLCGV
jgi:hypothetical protein